MVGGLWWLLLPPEKEVFNGWLCPSISNSCITGGVKGLSTEIDPYGSALALVDTEKGGFEGCVSLAGVSTSWVAI